MKNLLTIGLLSLLTIITPVSAKEAPSKETLFNLYKRMVAARNYSGALSTACRIYSQIDCKKITIVDDSHDMVIGAYAKTTSYSKKIFLAKRAFEFYGNVHPGWLAAIIGHENIHQKQSTYVTQVAGAQIRWFGDHYWEATLEGEAWDWMRGKSKYFDLNQIMIDEINSNSEYYFKLKEE